MVRAVRQWDRLPGEVAQFAPLEVFKTQANQALNNLVWSRSSPWFQHKAVQETSWGCFQPKLSYETTLTTYRIATIQKTPKCYFWLQDNSWNKQWQLRIPIPTCYTIIKWLTLGMCWGSCLNFSLFRSCLSCLLMISHVDWSSFIW